MTVLNWNTYNFNIFLLLNRLFTLADRIFTKSVIPFKKAALSKEEYALLIAILFSKSSKINKNFTQYLKIIEEKIVERKIAERLTNSSFFEKK